MEWFTRSNSFLWSKKTAQDISFLSTFVQVRNSQECGIVILKTLLSLTQRVVFDKIIVLFHIQHLFKYCIFETYISTDVGLHLVEILLSPELKIGTTLAIFRLLRKTPSHMHLFITFDRRGSSHYFENFKLAPKYHRIHDFKESMFRWWVWVFRQERLVAKI